MLNFISGREWQIPEPSQQKVEAVAAKFGFSKILSRLLVLRGVGEGELEDFLMPKLRALLPDPSVMADMDKGVSLVYAQQNKIAIYGDYDVDGITTAALLKSYFNDIGTPSEIFLPDRMLDGYGLSVEWVQKIEAQGFGMLMTVDCGAKDIEALTYAKKVGIEVVILDHHPTDVVPPAGAFVNPNGPKDESGLGSLTAGGVAFMFLVALNRKRKAAGDKTLDLMKFLDLVALSTVCDVAPLTGLNRAFVTRGLELLAQKNNLGLAALAEKSGMRGKPTVESFSFGLGPRINAAGRIGKASVALALLLSTETEEAQFLAAQLNTLNRQRQGIEKTILSEATLLVEEKELPKEVIVVAKEGWHPGVIGIIAARLKDAYQRTAAVIALSGADGNATGVGSVRSDGTLDLGALMTDATAQGLLLRGGGHRQAAGFTIAADKVAAFTAFFQEQAQSYKTNEPAGAAQIDGVLDFASATRALYDDLQKAAPYGKGNAAPLLLFTDGLLEHSRISGNGHLRCNFRPAAGGRAIEVVGFFQAQSKLGRKLQAGTGGLFHIVGSLRPAWRNMASGVEIALSDASPATSLKINTTAAE